MFRIGEFSRIARVSTRTLRHYDALGLLSPGDVDPATGYRSYHAAQLRRLNEILALKELGLSLEQVKRTLGAQVSLPEIKGMLALRKAELEQSLAEEATRLRQVESRLRQIDDEGLLADYDVVEKSVPAQPYLSLRREFGAFEEVAACVGETWRSGVASLPAGARDKVVVVAHGDFDEDRFDIEMGWTLARPTNRKATVGGELMTLCELPALPSCAAVVRNDPNYESHLAFGAIGRWMEAKGRAIAGPSREVFLEFPDRPDKEAVIEIQFPLTTRA